MGRVNTLPKRKNDLIQNAEQPTVQHSCTFEQLLLPDYLIVCEDFVQGLQNHISIIKTIDYLRPRALPCTPPRFVVIASFFRLPVVPISRFTELRPECRLVIQTPSKREVEIGPFPISSINENDAWLIERQIIDLSGSVEFTENGPYVLRIDGRTSESPYQTTHWRLFPIAGPTQTDKKVMQA
jgi:hypothetical protein